MRRGLFVDPTLKDDRFDFSGEPLLEEDVDEFREEHKEDVDEFREEA